MKNRQIIKDFIESRAVPEFDQNSNGRITRLYMIKRLVEVDHERIEDVELEDLVAWLATLPLKGAITSATSEILNSIERL